jgi:hypothetical protein
MDFKDYMKLLDNYKFVICLEGSGPDVHRNYESLLVGSIPINNSAVVKKLFDYYNICGIFVDDWHSLNENNFKNILNDEYDFKSAFEFLKVDTHIKNVKDII